MGQAKWYCLIHCGLSFEKYSQKWDYHGKAKQRKNYGKEVEKYIQ